MSIAPELTVQPNPKVPAMRPWPNPRFAVKYPRWKPNAGKPHVRLCGGRIAICVPAAIRICLVASAALRAASAAGWWRR
jgi:hypothetical protein